MSTAYINQSTSWGDNTDRLAPAFRTTCRCITTFTTACHFSLFSPHPPTHTPYILKIASGTLSSPRMPTPSKRSHSFRFPQTEPTTTLSSPPCAPHRAPEIYLIFVVPSIMLYSSEISPTSCNNCVFILRNGFTLHVSGDNLTHHQEYLCCIWPQVSRLT